MIYGHSEPLFMDGPIMGLNLKPGPLSSSPDSFQLNPEQMYYYSWARRWTISCLVSR